MLFIFTTCTAWGVVCHKIWSRNARSFCLLGEEWILILQKYRNHARWSLAHWYTVCVYIMYAVSMICYKINTFFNKRKWGLQFPFTEIFLSRLSLIQHTYISLISIQIHLFAFERSLRLTTGNCLLTVNGSTFLLCPQ